MRRPRRTTAPLPGTRAPRVTTTVPASTGTSGVTTVVAPSTAPPSSSSPSSAGSVASVAPSGFGVLQPEIGTKVDAAPGVTTPGDIRELSPNTWIFIPSEPDPNDARIQPPLPEDIEIITAYIEERDALTELITQRPMAAQVSERYAAATIDGGAAALESLLRPGAAAGQYFDVSAGVVFRPVVIADPRSDNEAFVFDCQLDGSVLRNADGSLVDGQVEGVKEYPQVARIERVDGRWLVAAVSSDDRVCS